MPSRVGGLLKNAQQSRPIVEKFLLEQAHCRKKQTEVGKFKFFVWFVNTIFTRNGQNAFCKIFFSLHAYCLFPFESGRNPPPLTKTLRSYLYVLYTVGARKHFCLFSKISASLTNLTTTQVTNINSRHLFQDYFILKLVFVYK